MFKYINMKWIRWIGGLNIVVLIVSFLNIHIQTSYDTVTAIWVFVFESNKNYILPILGLIGMALLVMSLFILRKTGKTMLLSGMCLLWVVVMSFYPDYFDLQREIIFNPQYLIILSSFLALFLKFYSDKRSLK